VVRIGSEKSCIIEGGFQNLLEISDVLKRHTTMHGGVEEGQSWRRKRGAGEKTGVDTEKPHTGG